MFIIITIITITAIGQNQSPKAQATRPSSAPGRDLLCVHPVLQGGVGRCPGQDGPQQTPSQHALSKAVLPPSSRGGKSLLKKKENPNPGCFAGGSGVNGEPGPEHRCRSLTDAVLVQTRMLSAQVHYRLYYWQPNHKRTISSSSPFLLPDTGP